MATMHVPTAKTLAKVALVLFILGSVGMPMYFPTKSLTTPEGKLVYLPDGRVQRVLDVEKYERATRPWVFLMGLSFVCLLASAVMAVRQYFKNHYCPVNSEPTLISSR